MELKPGYKQTEAGIIPEDWDAVSLSPRFVIATGSTPPTSDKSNYGGSFLFVSPADLGEHKFIRDTEKKLSSKGFQLSRKFPAGSTLFTCIGSTIGKTGLASQTLTSNQQINAVFPNECDNFEFVYYSIDYVSPRVKILAGAQAVPIVNKTSFGETIIPIPSTKAEQCAIATVLNDVDDLLDGLDQLITKKRDLKQAVMQQLLTGETRLPGFKGKWEVKRLGDHVRFLRNGVNSRAELTLDGPVRYLHYGDIHACAAPILSPATLPSLPSEKAKTLHRLLDGDLIFADASEDLEGVGKSVEICGATGTELVSGLHTIAARFDKSVLADGFKAYLQFCPEFSRQLRRLAAGTKVYATNRGHVASIEMPLPGIDEQVAIASVFNDMDTEIAALEQRRAKTRDLKQAMMQELLTGKTRLI